MPSREANRLVKSLDKHIARAADQDFPDTNSPIGMAAAAVEYIGLDDAGAWRAIPELIIAVVAFLRSERADGPLNGFDGLRECLDQVPVDPVELRAWFFDSFVVRAK